VNERSNLIAKLQSDFAARTAYIQAKVCTLVPSQIRALRLKSETNRQPDLAREAEMHQSRISALETAGANPTLGTLSAIASALRVGLRVEFVPFSEMLAWENRFSQDNFSVTKLDNDTAFLNPQFAAASPAQAPMPLVYKYRARTRHSGMMVTSDAVGDFSTLEGGNMRVAVQNGPSVTFSPIARGQQIPMFTSEQKEYIHAGTTYTESCAAAQG
jgi:transcriptional regulator with XRE-family HTH domain